MSDHQIRKEAGALLKLGVAMMSGSLVTLAVAFVVRVTILHRLNVEATGLYQSAWTLGSLYVGFILQAMGADFYPRLTASAHDNPICPTTNEPPTRPARGSTVRLPRSEGLSALTPMAGSPGQPDDRHLRLLF